MASNKYIVGLFDHEDNLVKAIRSFKKEKIEITDALTPFPVHGLEDELGLKDSRLHTAGFMLGLTGTTVALSVMTWVSTSNYPLNIGGKPHFSIPSFIPITFELTVLFAAVGMVIVYCIRNGLYPGAVPRILDERITDDRFALKFEIDNNTTKSEVDKIVSLLNAAGAVEISAKEFEDDTDIFEVETSEVDSLLFGDTDNVESTTDESLSEEEFELKKSTLLNVVGTVDADKKDDLKKVKGIGPVYEGKLNELGIYTFEQIAKLNDEAREAVEVLTGFPGRVEREDWIGQAKLLMNK